MRHIVVLLLALALPLLDGTGAAALAQGIPSRFEDVPPWHWAFDAVQRLAQQGVVQGFPRNDRDLALNAVVQVYGAFAHARHPEARAWAELFLTNLPAAWPQPLQRSTIVAFSIAEPEVRVAGPRGTVAFHVLVQVRLTRIALPAGQRPPERPPIVSMPRQIVVTVLKDTAGRWRVDYASLIAVQPEIFR